MRSLLVLLVVAACGGSDGSGVDAAVSQPDAPAIDAPPTGLPVVVIETTLGDLVVEVDDVDTPITGANFLAYVDSGFYDGTLVHRVIDDFVIQGGGFTTGLVTKAAGPPIELEIGSRSHIHGALSMARNPQVPDSATSQWFIVDWPDQGEPPQPAQLDGSFAVFGGVVEGFDVLAAITQVPTTTVGILQDVPVDEIVVTRAYRRE